MDRRQFLTSIPALAGVPEVMSNGELEVSDRPGYGITLEDRHAHEHPV